LRRTRVSNACWGIFRESTHSPGRESDDTEILRLTGKHLEAKGFQVELKTADEVNEIDDDRPRFVFLMCERVEVLQRLRTLEVSGVPHVNSPRAVHNTYRDRMIAVLDEAMANFHRYFFIMPTLARFEREIHERVERGEGVTAELLDERMAELFFIDGLQAEGLQHFDRLVAPPQRIAYQATALPTPAEATPRSTSWLRACRVLRGRARRGDREGRWRPARRGRSPERRRRPPPIPAA